MRAGVATPGPGPPGKPSSTYTIQYDANGGRLSTTLTTRVPDDLFAEIERISEEEHLDKSAVTRRLLERAVREHKLEAAVERYRAGEVTLRGAAAHADRSLRELIDELARRDVPIAYGEEDLAEDLAGLEDVGAGR